jgi:hypothetical protein
VLNAELLNMGYRQLHFAAPALTTTLRRSFAQKTNEHIDDTALRMWVVLSSSVFDEVDEEKMVIVARGEALIGSMEWIGY